VQRGDEKDEQDSSGSEITPAACSAPYEREADGSEKAAAAAGARAPARDLHRRREHEQ